MISAPIKLPLNVYRRIQRVTILQRLTSKKCDRVQTTADKHFFSWMDLYNHMPDEDRLKRCPRNPVMAIYDPGVLAKFGYAMDRYEGPVNQEQVDQLLAEYNVERNMCYWPHKSYLVE